MAVRLVLLAAALVTMAGTEIAPAAPQTLVNAQTPIDAFAQDGSRIAWSTHSCTRVNIRSLRTGAEAALSSPPFMLRCPHNTSHLLALSGERVLWTADSAGISIDAMVFTATMRDRRLRRVARLSWGPPANGRFLTGMDGDRGTLAFGWVEVDHLNDGAGGCFEEPVPCQASLKGGGVFTVSGGTAARIPGVPPPAFLAVSKGRVALAPMAPVFVFPEPSENGAVEVRDTLTGGLVTSFAPAGTARALALSGSAVAVLVQAADGTKRIERYGTATGALLAQVAVPLRIAPEIDMAGRWIVYSVKRAIYALDSSTGSSRLLHRLARPGARPRDLSIEGRRVAWAESSRVRAVFVPA